MIVAISVNVTTQVGIVRSAVKNWRVVLAPRESRRPSQAIPPR
jgi:hypothetical protein